MALIFQPRNLTFENLDADNELEIRVEEWGTDNTVSSYLNVDEIKMLIQHLQEQLSTLKPKA